MVDEALQAAVNGVTGDTHPVSWSICVTGPSGATVAAWEPAAVLPTASVGKVLLLLTAASRIESAPAEEGTLLQRDAVPPIGEAGLWQYLCVPDLPLNDVGYLIGSFSDNLATNVMLDHVGLASVHELTASLHLTGTALMDRVRAARGPADPPHLSVGSGEELSRLMGSLSDGTAVSPEACARVRAWLSTNADLSMVAGAFGLDPLAHPLDGGAFELFHKTGSDPGTRADVGHVRHGGRELAYAVIAGWQDTGADLLGTVVGGMRRIGFALRQYLTEPDG